MLQRAASCAYSWWWTSHIRTKQSKWMEQSLQDMEEKVHHVLELIDEDGDSFAKRAEMYYKKRPEIIHFVEESYKAYRALADRYDHMSTELQNANHTLATAFPEQFQYGMDEDDEDGGPRYPRKTADTPNIPTAPEDSIKELKSIFTVASKKLQKKKPSKSSTCKKVDKSSLGKAQALREIDKFQKDILALQTEKEFVKSSYETNAAKYWEIEEQLQAKQEIICKLQDEYGESMVIKDHEARSLMASAALKSCQGTLDRLQDKQEQAAEEAKLERKRIREFWEKLTSLKSEFPNNQIDQEKLQAEYKREKSKDRLEKSDDEEISGSQVRDDEEEINVSHEKQDLELLQEKVKEHFDDQNISLSVSEMVENIDELVNKVINLETSVSSQTILVKRLRSENDDLQTQIQSLEVDKESLANNASHMNERLREMEVKFHELWELNQSFEDQNSNLHEHFSEARYNLDNLYGRLDDVMPDEAIEITSPAEREPTLPDTNPSQTERTSHFTSPTEVELIPPVTGPSQIELTLPVSSPSEIEPVPSVTSPPQIEPTPPVTSPSKIERTPPVTSPLQMKQASPITGSSQIEPALLVTSSSQIEPTSPITSPSTIEPNPSITSVSHVESYAPVSSSSQIEPTPRVTSPSQIKPTSPITSLSELEPNSFLRSLSSIEPSMHVPSSSKVELTPLVSRPSQIGLTIPAMSPSQIKSTLPISSSSQIDHTPPITASQIEATLCVTSPSQIEQTPPVTTSSQIELPVASPSQIEQTPPVTTSSQIELPVASPSQIEPTSLVASPPKIESTLPVIITSLTERTPLVTSPSQIELALPAISPSQIEPTSHVEGYIKEEDGEEDTIALKSFDNLQSFKREKEHGITGVSLIVELNLKEGMKGQEAALIPDSVSKSRQSVKLNEGMKLAETSAQDGTLTEVKSQGPKEQETSNSTNGFDKERHYSVNYLRDQGKSDDIEDHLKACIKPKVKERLDEQAPSTTIDNLLDIEPKEEARGKEDEPNWKQLFINLEHKEKDLLNEYTTVLQNYKDVMNELSKVEKENEDGSVDELIRNLKSANAMKDEEIDSLRQKLSLMQRLLDENKDMKEHSRQTFVLSGEVDVTSVVTGSPNSGEKEDKSVYMKLTLPEHSKSMSPTEEKFRMRIDEVLEQNLDFWLRFSASFGQIQTLQSEVKDLQADLSKAEERGKRQEGSSSKRYNLKTEVRPIFKHLREIRTELTIWLDKSALLKDELKRRFSSLCDIQEEIKIAVKESAEEYDFTFTSYQAAKFQGEILNMKQENNKVSEELQAGIDHVKVLLREVDKTLGRPNYEHNHYRSKREQCSNQPNSDAHIPLQSFIFGVKPQKKKSSFLAIVSPKLQKKHYNRRSGPL